jgi:hypothetical protein
MGAGSSGRPLPTRCVAGALDLATRDIWMECPSPSPAPVMICGGRSTRMAISLISSNILVQSRGHKTAAKRFFRKWLKRLTYVPRVLVTDQLQSYGAAKREVLPSVEHRPHRDLNNRAENSHQPTRQREQRLQRFKSPGHAQRSLAAYGPMASHCRPRRHLLSAHACGQEMTQRFRIWQEVTGTALATYGKSEVPSSASMAIVGSATRY